MRRTVAYDPGPSESDLGKERIRRKFLWWPRRFKSDWRWLEWAPVVEQCQQVDTGDFHIMRVPRWVEVGFAYKEKILRPRRSK